MKILASVHDKTNLTAFLKGISQSITEVYASGNTYRHITEGGIRAINISELTGFEELLGGRVKTLHPAIFSGILSTRDEEAKKQLAERNFPEFDMVITNLYPFEEAAKTGELHNMIENIDIGGISLLRAAAKNFVNVVVLTSPDQYEMVEKELLQNSKVSLETRKRLALRAFGRAADYDIAIYQSLADKLLGTLPSRFYLKGMNGKELRYGENPDQKGFVYSDGSGNGIANAQPLQGKELSYNNLQDADAALETALDFNEPVAVVVKHNTPCGVATASTASEALMKAIEADSESVYGSVMALNRIFDEACLEAMSKYFVEVLIAPDYTSGALEGLKKKKNLRVLRVPLIQDKNLRVRSISNGFLVQGPLSSEFGELRLKNSHKANQQQIDDMSFAWKVVAHCRSNAIVLAKDGMTVGIGAGQTSRIEALRGAVGRAGDKSKGAVLASDAFFPFYDNVELASSAGVAAIVQPGGSVRDEEVIAKAEELGIPMYFTGKRVFLH